MSKTILVIDDEELLREILDDHFSSFDFNVILASSGNEGIEVLKTQQVDIVLTDMKMPGSDGMTILNYLKNNNISIPTYVCSGFVDDTAKQIEQYNVNKIIRKPFEIDTEFKEIEELSK